MHPGDRLSRTVHQLRIFRTRVFRSLDLLGSLQHSFPHAGPTGILLAAMFSERWDPLAPLRQCFQNVGPTGTLCQHSSFQLLDPFGPLQHTFQTVGPTGTLLRQSFQDFGPSSTGRMWAGLPEPEEKKNPLRFWPTLSRHGGVSTRPSNLNAFHVNR